MREVEAKFRISEPESVVAALETRGIELGAPFVQDDQAYAPAWWSYGMPKKGVPFARLRTVDGRHTFTVKRPRENEQSCDEHETDIDDREQMHDAITAMGFVPTVRIVKTRRTTLAEGFVLCLDEVHGAGTFLELECVAADDVSGEAVQAALVRFARRLGVESERVVETYDSLVRAALAGV